MKLTQCLVFALISSIISCSQESDDFSSIHIIGEWENTSAIENTNFDQSLIYYFKSNNIFEVYRIVKEENTNEVHGYLYYAQGTYSLEGSSLLLFDSVVYEHDDTSSPFSDFDQLTLSDDQFEEAITISFNDNNTELVFIYEPCNALENCLTSQSFKRI